MPNANDELSMAELERLLDSRRIQLEELQKKRARIQHQLDQIDAEIAELTGDRRSGMRGRRGPRAKNEKTLRDHVVEILSRTKKGLTLAELGQKVLDAGYKSGSSNFRNVLYQCVYNTRDVYHDDSTGTYKMKHHAAREKAEAK